MKIKENKKDMKLRAVINLRVSDPIQLKGTSLETQERECINYCKTMGWQIVDILKYEGISAEKTKIERVKELLEWAKENKGKVDVMVVYKTSRFARSKEHHFWLRSKFLENRILLRCVTEPIDETPMGQFFEGIMASYNEFDNEVRRGNAIEGLWTRVDQGLWPWGSCWGYWRPKEPDIKLLPDKLDESCWEDIRDVFNLYSTGKFTYLALGKEMNKRSVVNKDGKKLNFTRQQVAIIIANIRYTGFNRNKDGKLVKGLHPTIIDMSTWQKCQEIKDGRSNNAIKKRFSFNPDFVLRNKFTLCGICKKPLTACWSGRQNQKHPYYYCHNPKCPKYSVSIDRQDIENAFRESLRLIKPKPEYVELFNRTLLKVYEVEQERLRSQYSSQADTVKDIEQEIDYYARKNRAGVIPDSIAEPKLKELSEKLELAKSTVSETHDDELEIDALITFGNQFIRTPDLAWYDALPDDKIKIQGMIFPDGIYWNYPGFSNTRLGLPFELIKEFQASVVNDGAPRQNRTAISGSANHYSIL